MVKGLRAEMMYFKGTLDKLGVSMEIEHAGKYKDFGDMFTRSDMSPETREVMTSVVDDLYGNLVAGIAEGRRKSPEEVRAIIDRGPFTAPVGVLRVEVDARDVQVLAQLLDGVALPGDCALLLGKLPLQLGQALPLLGGRERN